MAKVDLTHPEQRVIGEVLQAFACGDFVPADLMHTLLGYGPQELQALSDCWGTVHWSEMPHEYIWLVGAVFDALCVYPHDNWGRWYQHVHVPPQRAERIFDKWAYTDSVCFIDKSGKRRFANSTSGTRFSPSRSARISSFLQTIQSESVLPSGFNRCLMKPLSITSSVI
ncbi:hypothetical protein GO986_04875 [Deinococcus sp. HMF7620]|uniref:Uncharacterized protein n=1 Tax=Deinococcus arboris TaxID=2682977 RepID=A0A7C9HQK4_9DEIO|nr:hypothetical protein [Deinococcus arboris]MVN86093.1 hypothetical protein [Deinococcus arboris]